MISRTRKWIDFWLDWWLDNKYARGKFIDQLFIMASRPFGVLRVQIDCRFQHGSSVWFSKHRSGEQYCFDEPNGYISCRLMGYVAMVSTSLSFQNGPLSIDVTDMLPETFTTTFFSFYLQSNIIVWMKCISCFSGIFCSDFKYCANNKHRNWIIRTARIILLYSNTHRNTCGVPS